MAKAFQCVFPKENTLTFPFFNFHCKYVLSISVGVHQCELFCVDLFIFTTTFLGRKNKRSQGCSFYPHKKPGSQMSHWAHWGEGLEARTEVRSQESSSLPPGCFKSASWVCGAALGNNALSTCDNLSLPLGTWENVIFAMRWAWVNGSCIVNGHPLNCGTRVWNVHLNIGVHDSTRPGQWTGTPSTCGSHAKGLLWMFLSGKK